MALSTSLVSGIAGLKVHNTMLEVISNNIANVNTTGYKYSRINFADAISQTRTGASGPSSGYGGVNPAQVGLGVSVNSIDTIMTQGPFQATGNATDMAIDGEGFFMVREGNQILYTRAGDFTFDGQGNLVDRSGALVQGWNVTQTYEERIYNSGIPNPLAMYEGIYEMDSTNLADIGNIQVDPDFTMMPRSTHITTLSGNLDTGAPQNAAALINTALQPGGLPCILAGAVKVLNTQLVPQAPPVGLVTQVTLVAVQLTSGAANEYFLGAVPDHQTTSVVYDQLGNERELTFWFFQANDLTAAPGINAAEYAWYAFDSTDGPPSAANCLGGTNIEEPMDRNTNTAIPTGQYLVFNPDGSLQNQGAVGLGDVQEFKPILYIENTFWQNGPAALPAPQLEPSMQWIVGTEQYIMTTIHFGSAWDAARDIRPDNDGGYSAGPGKTVGTGYRDGLTGDAAGTTQTVAGVSTYVPYHSAYINFQDGYEQGSMISMNVGPDGTIMGAFDNDQMTPLGQVAICTFPNAEGLQRVGTSKFALSANSGSPIKGTPQSSTRGAIRSGYLEESNVELADQLTRLIIAQRGFEVNSRAISTANSILNTLVTLGQ